MKNLSDIKRRIQLGARLECVENTRRPDVNGTTRTVAKVQTNGFACTVDGWGKPGELFWTYYPKAAEVEIVDADAFKFLLGKPEHHVILRFVP